MVGREFGRGVDLDMSGRDIFGYEEVEQVGDFVSVSGPVWGFICGEVVEIVGGYALQEVFASCCDKSAAPLRMFGVIVSSS